MGRRRRRRGKKMRRTGEKTASFAASFA